MRSIPSKFRAARSIMLLAAFASCTFVAAPIASAYQVSPMHHYLDLSGKGATSFMTIDNTHDFPLTVELTIQRRHIKNGEVIEDIPADDDFLIFPPQAIIQPGKKQRVQIRYVGTPLEKSEFYRLVVSQVPIKLSEENTTKLDVAYNFNSAVFVAPKGAKAKLDVGAISASAGGYSVALSNSGNYHALLPSFTWTGSDGSKSAALDVTKFPFGDRPYIEPGGSRTIQIPAAALGDISSLSSLKISAPKK